MQRPITEIEGRVAAVSQREGRYGVKLGDDWYGGFGRCPVQKGDEIALTFFEKDGWRNIARIRCLVARGESAPLRQEDAWLTREEIDELQQRFVKGA